VSAVDPVEEGRPLPADAEAVPRNAVALGLSALAVTTFVSSASYAGLLGGGSLWIGLAPALAYGGLVQLLAGMWMMRERNLLAATTLSSFGAYWLSYASLELWLLPRTPEASRGPGLAAFFFAWAVVSLYVSIACTKHSRSVLVTFTLLTLMLAALAAGSLGGQDWLLRAGGWAGMASALASWYAAAAMVIGDSFGRRVLPY
jgi:uncharacterized protein